MVSGVVEEGLRPRVVGAYPQERVEGEEDTHIQRSCVDLLSDSAGIPRLVPTIHAERGGQ